MSRERSRDDCFDCRRGLIGPTRARRLPTARDAVPDGTIERLQNDAYDGVIETAHAQNGSVMKRLTAVLAHSTVVDLSSYPLVTWAAPPARRGICHQLAYNQRLTWTPKEQS